MSDIAPDEISHENVALEPTITNKLTPTMSRPARLVRGVTESFMESRPPVGMFHAYGQYASVVPTMEDIQVGKFGEKGWSGPGQRRNSKAHRESDWGVLHHFHKNKKAKTAPGNGEDGEMERKGKNESGNGGEEGKIGEVVEVKGHDPSVPYANGYQFPPKHSKWQATTIALRGFGRYVITPVGFIITIYSLNVVAWGGMLFLILCRATPGMTHPYGYDDNRSSAKKWLEIDSQILNALFCVTGLGLLPWRFRDLYYLLQWRWKKNHDGLRRLAGIHRGWFRLHGSQEIPATFNPLDESEALPPAVEESALALPIALSPSAPLTGERAPPSAYWKLDLVIWAFVANSLLQIMLCGFMWGMNRFQRPSAVVGLLISVGCVVAMVAGWYIFAEGKRVKKIEGVEVSEEDMMILREMRGKEGQDRAVESV